MLCVCVCFFTWTWAGICYLKEWPLSCIHLVLDAPPSWKQVHIAGEWAWLGQGCVAWQLPWTALSITGNWKAPLAAAYVETSLGGRVLGSSSNTNLFSCCTVQFKNSRNTSAVKLSPNYLYKVWGQEQCLKDPTIDILSFSWNWDLIF